MALAQSGALVSDRISNGHRSLILGRIRDILGARPVSARAEYDQIARDYGRPAGLDAEGRIELLVDRLQHYQVGVYRCEPATIRRTIADVLADRKKGRLVVPPDLPAAWVPADLATVPDRALSHDELDGSDGVLTGCALAIAQTGTIVLRHQAGEGRRALTLVPDYHLCVVLREQIVESVPEAVARLAQWRPALVTTISGPSATADIEMTRVRGVHGPRTLDVVIAA